MIIEGPLRISTEMSDESSGFAIKFSFTEAFQQCDREDQVADFSRYLEELRRASATLEATDPNQQGMLIILQVGEQLLPLIQAGELPLNETLEIEVEQHITIPGFLSNESGRIN